MTRQYSPKNFLRRVPKPLLKEYFSKKEWLGDIKWDKPDKVSENVSEKVNENVPEKVNKKVSDKVNEDVILAAIEKMDKPQQIEVEQIFREINELSCELGAKVLAEEANFWQLDIGDQLENMKSPYERAFWMYLNHPVIFRKATDLVYMDKLSSWKTRQVGKDLKPKDENADMINLADGIIKFYRQQSRGKRCHIDPYLRANPVRHCFFAYPEDYATTDLSYDDENELTPRPRKPAFEIIFVYKPKTGMLELSAKGKKDEKENLMRIFCQKILGLDDLPDSKKTPFDLSALRKDMAFPTEPQDGIETVKLKMLRLDMLNEKDKPKGRRITVEMEPSKGQTIHQLMTDVLNKNNVPLENMTIAKAKFQFQFAGVNGKKGKSLTFEISIPDTCSLKDDPLDQIAKKCLGRWGLLCE